MSSGSNPVLDFFKAFSIAFSNFGCSPSGAIGAPSHYPVNSPQPQPKLGFVEQDNELAYRLFQELEKTVKGLPLPDLDHGYPIVNFGYQLAEGGNSCDDRKAPSCIVGKEDGIISSEEVWEYALNHSDNNQIRELTEQVLGHPLPWLLDDFDPRTTFDEEIRQHIRSTIKFLDTLLHKQGLKPGTDEYEKKLAVGLHFWVEMPGPEIISKILDHFEEYTKELENLGLSEFKDYLKRLGGLRIDPADKKEYTALEAIQKRTGMCTELSKVLFAVLKMAGLKPFFVNVNPWKTDLAKMKSFLNESPAYGHVCIGIRINNKMRLLDPSIFLSDAPHGEYYTLSLRQYLSLDRINYGEWFSIQELEQQTLEEYNLSLSLDPLNPMTYYSRGIALWKKGDLDKAIVEFSKALLINPYYAMAYTLRGQAYTDKKEWNHAIHDFDRAIQINPDMSIAYQMRGLAWERQSEWEKAISDYSAAIKYNSVDSRLYQKRGDVYSQISRWDAAIQDYSTALSINNKDTLVYLKRAYGWIQKRNGDQSIADLNEFFRSKPDVSLAYDLRGLSWIIKDNWDKALEDFNEAIRLDASQGEYFAHRGFVWLKKGEEAKARIDFATTLKIFPGDETRILLSLTEYFDTQWSRKPKAKATLSVIESQTDLDAIGAESHIILSSIYWEMGKKDKAQELAFMVLDVPLNKKGRFSYLTHQYVERLFQHLPEDMKKLPAMQARRKKLASH